MAYSYGQLEQLWVQAGGSRALAPLMAAIAMAESAGNPAANNYQDNGGTQTSWGLWQVSNGTHSWPGQQDPNNPLNNARYAVQKYQSQGLSAWGTYDSGAYKQYYQGGVAPSSLPQGGSATATQAEDIAWYDVLSGNFTGVLEKIWSLGNQAGQAASAADALTQIARGFLLLLRAFEWFFVPSHIVRLICAAGGIMFAIPGVYALMRSAQGGYGDVTLGLGILLITISGVLMFIAFHNIPTDVTNLQELLGWMTASIREGKPAAEKPTVNV
jgi:hypothetical protein